MLKPPKLTKAERLPLVAERIRDESLPVAERSTSALGRHFGVSHRTICNDLEELGIKPLGKPSAGGLSKEERQAIVVRLYPTHTCAEIAAEIRKRTGKPCSVGPIKLDIRELEERDLLVIRGAGPRRKYPKPEPRRCECGSCEGEIFTPTAVQVKDGYGRFKDRSHYRAWKRSQVLAVAAEAAPLWNEGLTLDEIETARPDLPRDRVWRALRIARDDGALEVAERRRGKQLGRYRERGRFVKCKAREFEWCPHGETERWVFASLPTEFLSSACWARYRWEHGLGGLRSFVRAAAALGGSWHKEIRLHWFGKWSGKLPPGPGKKPRGRPSGPALTAQQLADVDRLRRQGWGIRSIAKQLGVNWRRVEEVVSA